MEYEVTSDGRTVWVNNVACIGRFGRGGIDIHKSLDAQIAGEGEYLYCTHGQPTAEDWTTFQQKMKELHNIEVGDKHRPKWLGPIEVKPTPLGVITVWRAEEILRPAHLVELPPLGDVSYDLPGKTVYEIEVKKIEFGRVMPVKPTDTFDPMLGKKVTYPSDTKREVQAGNTHLTEDGKPEGWEQ